MHFLHIMLQDGRLSDLKTQRFENLTVSILLYCIHSPF